jgi:hypothetical protein
MIRQCLLVLSALVPLLFIASANAAGQHRDMTVQWVIKDLEKAMLPPVDMNRIASLTFPLSSLAEERATAEVATVLDAVAATLENQALQELGCGELVDIHLTAGFLAQTGRVVNTDRVTQTLAQCELGGESRFDLANAMLFYCRYSGRDYREYLPTGLETLESMQREDGAFLHENGKPWFYLTSHGLLAVHYCGGSREVVRRGIQRLQHLLPRFAQAGFHDGLIESLIFLKWLGADIPNAGAYTQYLKSRVLPDGGICFSQKRGCKAHWHAVSLLLQLRAMEGW